MTILRDAALAYAGRGWRVFPLHGIVRGRCTCARGDCPSPGKHPLVRRGLHDATTEELAILDWWRGWRRANIGLVTGAESGIAVIDVDLPTALSSIDRLVAAAPGLTLTGLTGGGGIHLFYANDDPNLGNSAGRLPGLEGELPGVDLRANGGYVVAPPSVHRSGARYSWLDGGRPISPSPAWLRQQPRPRVAAGSAGRARFHGDGTAYGVAVLQGELRDLREATVGRRNHCLNRAAFVVAQVVAGGELLESAARSSLLAMATAIGLDEAEAVQTFDSAFAAGARSPRCAPHRLARNPT